MAEKISRMLRRACLLVLVWLLGCFEISSMAADEPDSKQFKEEYEQLNGTERDGHQLQTLEIPEDFPVVYADSAQILDVLQEGTGVVYFGFAQCPWCRTLLKTLFSIQETFTETDADLLFYYYDLRPDRDEHVVNAQGEEEVLQEASEFYLTLLEMLEEERIYMPTLVFVKEGEIMAVHTGTVDSQESGYDVLSSQEEQELSETLKREFALLK
jgi:cytochrome oxidase Cu insertion factor (SCO1/SenC/PrrC family)